jgi:hypothetical protein
VISPFLADHRIGSLQNLPEGVVAPATDPTYESFSPLSARDRCVVSGDGSRSYIETVVW